MYFLQEVLRGVKRVDDDNDEMSMADIPDDLDISFGDDIPDADQDENFADDLGDDALDAFAHEFGAGDDLPDDAELMGDDPSEDPMAGVQDPSTTSDESRDPFGAGDVDLEGDDAQDDIDNIDVIAHDATDDPNRQGTIRAVKKAHLVYKREGDDGFEEMWVYNVGSLKDELDIRKAILAGTDIKPGKTVSDDGSQTYSIWSAGNAEVLRITGLPN